MTYILAEIASAHMGDPELCLELIHKAKEAGADGVKVQVWTPNEINLPDKYMPLSEHKRIIENGGSNLWLQYYGEDSYEVVSLYDEHNLIDGREKWHSRWHDFIGTQEYPTPIKGSLSDRRKYSEWAYADHTAAEDLKFRYVIPAMAIAAGATLIEKHICLDREKLKERSKDWVSALEPHEFKEFVEFIREAETAL